MTLITITLNLILVFLAALHVYWGFGGLLPGKTKQELIDLVFGKGEKFPSRFMCLFVAIFLVLFSLLPVVWLFRDELTLDSQISLILRYLIGFVSGIFFLRGILGYFPLVTKQWKPIFVYYTKRIYNPLCFLIGSAFLILIL